jgi:anti-sigma factor RsiW
MRTCNLFDKYRDGELDAAARSEFESHLAACPDCRAKKFLLNNLVQILKREEIQPPDLAAQIARRAFRPDNSWDTLVISWLRPGPALTVLTLALVLFSFLWLTPGSQQASTYSEYETLMDETDAEINFAPDTSQARNDSELILWLE